MKKIVEPIRLRHMQLLTFITFCFKNYLRQHRYLRELGAAVIFTIFFEGFLTSDVMQENIWMIFVVFALILNLLTAPSLFYLEKGNTLHFMLSKPHGRRNMFLAKIILIVLIDVFFVLLFTIAYGLRFWSPESFLLAPVRLLFVIMILTLSTLLMSFTYTYKPQFSWLIMIVIILGCVINKAPLFPIQSLAETAKLAIFALPPIQELIFLSISLTFDGWASLFFAIGFLQAGILLWLSYRLMLRKDLV